MLGPIGNQTIIQNTTSSKSTQAKTQAKADAQAAQSSAFGAALTSNLETNTAAAEDLFSPQAFERTMNNWLTATIQRQNACRTETYNQAMADWKVNSERCRQLGIAQPPQPEAPKLEAVEAKPSGWWFLQNA